MSNINFVENSYSEKYLNTFTKVISGIEDPENIFKNLPNDAQYVMSAERYVFHTPIKLRIKSAGHFSLDDIRRINEIGIGIEVTLPEGRYTAVLDCHVSYTNPFSDEGGNTALFIDFTLFKLELNVDKGSIIKDIIHEAKIERLCEVSMNKLISMGVFHPDALNLPDEIPLYKLCEGVVNVSEPSER